MIRHTVNSVEGLIEEVQQSAEHVGTSDAQRTAPRWAPGR